MRINWLLFALAFAAGCVFHWLRMGEPTVVTVHPTPDNAGKVVYRDMAGTAYVYRAEEVHCPLHVRQRRTPLQFVEP